MNFYHKNYLSKSRSCIYLPFWNNWKICMCLDNQKISLLFFFWLAHLCGEGWIHVGDACLRINSSRENYDNAKLYCYNLSGNLASLTTSKEVEFVLDEIQKYTQQVQLYLFLLWEYAFNHIAIGNESFFFVFKSIMFNKPWKWK